MGSLGGFLLVSSQLGREGFMASIYVWNADGNGGEAGGGGLGEREREREKKLGFLCLILVCSFSFYTAGSWAEVGVNGLGN